ncbi:hypothetical protein BD410DRAFT_788822 [Rickenella mellea]|uniref:Uncharacterized protein n=1 Tax=Rickenella mellea TaxID=50990 RepID=A0A4Y7Q5N8_9AGAM|nr:hypothetical protein BD410DRAFT_788822 [Rickenella mellea]
MYKVLLEIRREREPHIGTLKAIAKQSPSVYLLYSNGYDSIHVHSASRVVSLADYLCTPQLTISNRSFGSFFYTARKITAINNKADFRDRTDMDVFAAQDVGSLFLFKAAPLSRMVKVREGNKIHQFFQPILSAWRDILANAFEDIGRMSNDPTTSDEKFSNATYGHFGQCLAAGASQLANMPKSWGDVFSVLTYSLGIGNSR